MEPLEAKVQSISMHKMSFDLYGFSTSSVGTAGALAFFNYFLSNDKRSGFSYCM
jgi:hypothetical protein